MYLPAVRWGHHPERCHSGKMASVLLDISSNGNAAAVERVRVISAKRWWEQEKTSTWWMFLPAFPTLWEGSGAQQCRTNHPGWLMHKECLARGRFCSAQTWGKCLGPVHWGFLAGSQQCCVCAEGAQMGTVVPVLSVPVFAWLMRSAQLGQRWTQRVVLKVLSAVAASKIKQLWHQIVLQSFAFNSSSRSQQQLII